VTGPLFTARQVGELLGISPRTVLSWTRAGRLPAFKLPSGAVRYEGDELDAWLAAHAVGRADSAAEERDHPDAPSAARQDTTRATLRPVTTPDPARGIANEED
jgi:excisionase family DNA binding protein